MKKFIILVVPLLSSCVIGQVTFQPKEKKGELEIRITRIKTETGKINISMVDSPIKLEKFMQGSITDTFLLISRKAVIGEIGFIFEGYFIPGNYCILAYHDENDNQELDRQESGIPKEGFGISSSEQPPRKMDWENCKITLTKEKEIIEIPLYYLDDLKNL